MDDDPVGALPSLEEIRSWPEWAAYVADPAGPLFNALCVRATPTGEGRVAEVIEAALPTLRSWKAAQHLSLLHHRSRRLTEAWYFAQLGAEWSGDDVRALVALAQVLEERRLPSMVSPLLGRIASALEALAPAARVPFQQFVVD